MPRPKRCRRVCCEPGYTFFKPQGVPLTSLAKRDLGLDELEALRLADVLGLPQADGAKMMNVSQPTFNRILAAGRSKTAECVVNGLAIRIESPEASNSEIRREEETGMAGTPCRHRRRGGR
ncbi:MAG: DUF134 domain-containing protein [Thermoplasmata archaeon]|jgi:predicted DNA-binding protein (UPF0251 family)|nr:DUF134 domain-containing protein [Thermoplasmata archaeon]